METKGKLIILIYALVIISGLLMTSLLKNWDIHIVVFICGLGVVCALVIDDLLNDHF